MDSNSPKEKAEVFKNFCNSIWSSKNRRRTYARAIRFKVREDLLNTEVGKVFDIYSAIEYKTYKSMSNEDDWCSLIRQKINNLYTHYFDKEVVLNKDYMNLLGRPRDLYYKWIYGEEFNVSKLTDDIDNALDKAAELKLTYQKQKMELSWNEYKVLVEEFLQKIFNNCISLSDYEKKVGGISMLFHFSIEDNFYVRYICKSLGLYMMNYQKEYYGVKRGRNVKYKRCVECGALIYNSGNRKMYCDECAKERERKRKRNIAHKYRKNKNSEIENLDNL